MTRKEVEILKNGGVILYPTDTIWGIGCDATQKQAIQKVIDIKGRTGEKHFILLCKDVEMISQYVETIPQKALDLIKESTSPLTIIYPKAKNLPIEMLSNDGTIGIRIPNHHYCQEILKELNRPLVSSSANISGEKSPTCFEDISTLIKEKADFISPKQFQANNTQPSSIIKVFENGEVLKIR
ncbi:MAG: threonylcarbamoyl-AMP synthase [Bacteroidales bacterium]|nr:threonylcarbamoyl-AMP synthase [Bacteroidales bacterium]